MLGAKSVGHFRHTDSFPNVRWMESRETIGAVTSSTNLKKPLLLILLSTLALFEADVLEGFLPYEWRHAIHQQSERVFPSKQYDPHPDMDWEFELGFRQHPWDRTVVYGVSAILAIGNAYLIAKVWKAFRRLKWRTSSD